MGSLELESDGGREAQLSGRARMRLPGKRKGRRRGWRGSSTRPSQDRVTKYGRGVCRLRVMISAPRRRVFPPNDQPTTVTDAANAPGLTAYCMGLDASASASILGICGPSPMLAAVASKSPMCMTSDSLELPWKLPPRSLKPLPLLHAGMVYGFAVSATMPHLLSGTVSEIHHFAQ